MTLQKIHSLIINNSLYNLRDQWQRRDGPEVLMVSFETFSIQKLNFCNFAFAWERDDFDRKIAKFRYSYRKCTRAVLKEPPCKIIYAISLAGFKFF